MILDALTESVPLNREASVAIVGAGPAGMTLARELAGVADVLIIEGGGIAGEESQQEFLLGDCDGIAYPLTETRARQFGGSSALWAGYCAVFDLHDFGTRAWVPETGWPFGIEAIQPYYRPAAELLSLAEPNFDARDVARRAGVRVPFDDGALVPTVWRFGAPTRRFGDHFRAEFEASPNVTTLLHANVVNITLDAGHGAVTELAIRTPDGRDGRVSASLFVLASGGIETPRLMLNSDTQVAYGVGNASGMVGRCFMEHPHRAITPLVVEHIQRLDHWTARGRCDDGCEFTWCLGLPAAAQEQERILNARAHVYFTPSMRADERPKVGLFMEQAPNRNSRIQLSNRLDSIGMRRIRLDWQLTDLDWRTYERTASALAREFERSGCGRMLHPIDPAAREHESVLHSNHHLGTTRMSENPEDGVVNADCRVHDLSNLYIIGGSVFPTVSWANPTFTLLALTLRLAAHLRTRILRHTAVRQPSAGNPQ